jgi:hypothetical protein
MDTGEPGESSLQHEIAELFNASDTLRNMLTESVANVKAAQVQPPEFKIDTEKAALQQQISMLRKEIRSQASEFAMRKEE